MSKPSLFIGSSIEQLPVARAIKSSLADDADVEVWDQGLFGLGTATLEALEEALPRLDFAVLVLAADDVLQSRGEQQPVARDNVLFELGLFMGQKGRRRAFFVLEEDALVKLPSDLWGITPAMFRRSKVGLQASLRPACKKIRLALKSQTARRQPLAPTPRVADKLLESLAFDKLLGEHEATLTRLEQNDAALLQQISADGDCMRLFDGLYMGPLYVSRAVVTGSGSFGNSLLVDHRFVFGTALIAM